MIGAKPCPFCGLVPRKVKHFKIGAWRLVHRCKVIGYISIPAEFTEDLTYTIEMWNTRKDPK